MPNSTSSATKHINKLMAFRQAAYECLGPARDALFELADAVLLAPPVRSFAEFSQCPVFRRRWPSLYEALQDGRPDRYALLERYAQQLPRPAERLICMGDHTAWPRPQAYTLRERTVEYQPTPVPGAPPITLGQGYATLAWLPEPRGSSWALPLLHERLTPTDNPLSKAAAQLRAVCAQAPQRVLALWDAEYGCAPFVQQTADLPCDKLMRLRSNRVLYGPPPPYRGRGRPAVRGRKFKFHDARTWGKPVEQLEVDDPTFGALRVQLWANLHFKQAPGLPLWVLRLERLSKHRPRRHPRVLWLGWCGEPPPPLLELWPLYFRRAAGDHWYRFAKQTLRWTLPRCQTPEQGERWSDLMPLVTWELWLARPLVTDRPLPWQKPQTRLTPGRVRQSLGGVFAQIGTPAQAPKPRGKSAGWPAGRPRRKAPRYPVVKKR